MFKKLFNRKRRASDLEQQSLSRINTRSSALEEPMDKFIYRFSYDEAPSPPTPPSPTLHVPDQNPHVATSSTAPSSDEITILVDSRLSRPSEFDLPTSLLSQHSLALYHLIISTPAVRELIARPPFAVDKETGNIYLLKIFASHFADFAGWLLAQAPSHHQSQGQSPRGSGRKGTILPFPHNGVQYAILASADRLISAIALGILLESPTYQNAAIRELHPLLPLLERPEVLIEPLWTATAAFKPPEPHGAKHPLSLVPRRLSLSGKGNGNGKGKGKWESAHPARRMMVGIIADRYGGRNTACKDAKGETESMRDFWELFSASGGKVLASVEAYLLEA